MNDIHVYTVYDLSKLLRVHAITVKSWIKKGNMKARKVTQGKIHRYLIAESEVERILTNESN